MKILSGILLVLLVNPPAYSQSAAAVGGTGLKNVEAMIPTSSPRPFNVVEATITQIQDAIKSHQLTATELVNLYLERIKAYNGVCVNQPEGILGPVTPIAHAGQLNALMTLNLRPATRKQWGFDDRKARSMTDPLDNNPNMPDALEVAAKLDKEFASTGQLAGPLHGVVFSIKDLLDTYDMRTTSGADADYANDRPPADATIIKRLRDAGAIILAKANFGEYASGSRSSFGGTMCNPYDTMRDIGGSSGGSATSVAASLVTCAIVEEGGPSIRMPSRFNNIVGLSQSQGLVSRDGMIGGGTLSDRNGAGCRTVEDVARVLDVIAGYDKADDLTVYSIGRTPKEGYASFAKETSLKGMTIGVVREYMDKSLFTKADSESIDIVDKAIGDLRSLGATIVDPGPGGALFQSCLDQYMPQNLNAYFISQYPSLFPAGTDHIPQLVDLYFNPSLVPVKFTIRSFGPAASGEMGTRAASSDTGPRASPEAAVGESKYYFDRYLRKRGDANIKDLTDLIAKSHYYSDDFKDTRFRDVKTTLERDNMPTTLDVRLRNANRIAIQQTVMQCMAVMHLDAITYPTGNIPPAIIKAPVEPDINGRSHQAWTLLGQMGFPAMTVPAGFTTAVYDRVRDPAAPGGTRLVGPVPAKLPVGIDFLAMPFNEATIFKIASAYESATHHRMTPPEFGPLPQGH
jgi:Asp-tRNA(Asn)/Glu-tRNA(Gln) amidotransferase A subunit family amidase